MVSPSSGSQVHKNPVVGSDHFRQGVGIPSKDGQRCSVWESKKQRMHVGDLSSGSRFQLSLSLTQTGVGSFKPNKACFSGPSIFEKG